MSRLAFRALAVLALGLAAFAALASGARPLRAQSAAGNGSPQSDLRDFRARMEKWVETRQLISEEESEWEAERETLRATRELLRREKQALETEVRELEEIDSAADQERRELLLARGEYQRANRALEDRIHAMEQEVLALAPRLPEPLREKLELLLVQIPEDPDAAGLRLGQRLMNVLGVLAQAERFNDTATFVAETRAVRGDQKVQVRTLYWGLGQAIYVDAQGRSAGIGRPAAGGWEFSDEPGLAEEARRLLDIYEGNVDAIDFVRLPVEIR